MYTQPQIEWSSSIDQLAQDYRTGHAKRVVHGLQKDAIQNAWGARAKVRGWGVSFELLTGRDGRIYLTMTDRGTTGLTGMAYDDPETIPDNLPVEERLARFENMNFSGGNYGPGLYGRGKLLFQAASRIGKIAYDSQTSEEQYRLGGRFQEGRRLQQFPKVAEGQAARNLLDKYTGGTLHPLNDVGTRITIFDPLDEIVESIQDGTFISHIEETWWEILYKHRSGIEISVVADGQTSVAACPSMFGNLASGKFADANSFDKEIYTVTVRGVQYRVKRILMAKTDRPIPDALRGLCVQRKGMKVGTIDLKDIPADLDEYFFGFIELDKKYEEVLAEAEDLVHYSFGAQFSSYRELKKSSQLHFDEFKRKLGYDVDPEQTADKKAEEALRAASDKLNDIFKDLGILGAGPKRQKRKILVSVASVAFPVPGSKRVEIGDTLRNVAFRICS